MLWKSHIDYNEDEDWKYFEANALGVVVALMGVRHTEHSAQPRNVYDRCKSSIRLIDKHLLGMFISEFALEPLPESLQVLLSYR